MGWGEAPKVSGKQTLGRTTAGPSAKPFTVLGRTCRRSQCCLLKREWRAGHSTLLPQEGSPRREGEALH